MQDSDSQNASQVLADIEQTIRRLRSDLRKNSARATHTDIEKERMQEMIKSLEYDRELLQRQKSELEQDWLDSRSAHRNDIDNHRTDIERMKTEMQDLVTSHKVEVRHLVDEHRREMTQSRDQFENVMRVMISRLGFDADDVTGLSRENSKRKLKSPPPPNERQPSFPTSSPRHRPNSDAQSLKHDSSDSDDDVTTPRAPLTGSARRRPPSRTRLLSPAPSCEARSGATTPQNPLKQRLMSPGPPPADDRNANPPRLALRRKSARSRRLVLDSMRVSPNSLDEEDELETASVSHELPPISGGAPRRNNAVGRYVEESNQLLLNRSAHLSAFGHGVTSSNQRENSFSTITDLTRKAGKKSMMN